MNSYTKNKLNCFAATLYVEKFHGHYANIKAKKRVYNLFVVLFLVAISGIMY